MWCVRRALRGGGATTPPAASGSWLLLLVLVQDELTEEMVVDGVLSLVGRM